MESPEALPIGERAVTENDQQHDRTAENYENECFRE
jgi:hypothetical protein